MRSDDSNKDKIAPDVARREALLSCIGLWKDRTDLPETDEYIRQLRGGDRLERIWGIATR